MQVDEWGIDLAVGAPHKCIGGPSSIAFVAVSPAAWSTHQKQSIFLLHRNCETSELRWI